MKSTDWLWPRIFAHRGGGMLAPENTLEAFAIAARHACGVEFDVMLSADGTPHLMHDDALERTTDGHGRLADHSDAVLARLDASRGFDAFRGARVPRLTEAAARCRELGLGANLEIKPARGAAARTGEVVARLARDLWRGMTPPLLSSFSEAALSAAHEAAPELPRGLLVERLPDDWQSRCARLGVVSLHADVQHTSPAQIAAVKAAGLWLVLYTENNPRRAALHFAHGADALITDRPDRVLAPAPRP